jgi:hypothetical protein
MECCLRRGVGIGFFSGTCTLTAFCVGYVCLQKQKLGRVVLRGIGVPLGLEGEDI